MKVLGSVMATLILIVCAGFWLNHELQMSTNELIQQIDQVGTQINENNWPEAMEQTNKLEQVWEEKAKWWPIFLEHQEMDNIEFAMAKFKEYVANKNTSLSMGQLSEIRLMIEHIPEKEEVNIKNIL
jgi:hypothetical protein